MAFVLMLRTTCDDLPLAVCHSLEEAQSIVAGWTEAKTKNLRSVSAEYLSTERFDVVGFAAVEIGADTWRNHDLS